MGAENKGALLDSEAMMNMDIGGAMGKPVFAPDPTKDMYGRNLGISSQRASTPEVTPKGTPQLTPQFDWFRSGIENMLKFDGLQNQGINGQPSGMGDQPNGMINQPNMMGGQPMGSQELGSQYQQPINGLMGNAPQMQNTGLMRY